MTRKEYMGKVIIATRNRWDWLTKWKQSVSYPAGVLATEGRRHKITQNKQKGEIDGWQENLPIKPTQNWLKQTNWNDTELQTIAENQEEEESSIDSGCWAQVKPVMKFSKKKKGPRQSLNLNTVGCCGVMSNGLFMLKNTPKWLNYTSSA